MIIVRVELHSARTGKITELARMKLCNVGGTEDRRDYSVETFRGRSLKALDNEVTNRTGGVTNFPSPAIHIWHLIAEALKSLHYDRRPKGHG